MTKLLNEGKNGPFSTTLPKLERKIEQYFPLLLPASPNTKANREAACPQLTLTLPLLKGCT